MKVNINKLQGGGLVGFTPILKTPFQSQISQPQQTTTEAKQSNSLIDEDLYKELVKAGGLVNDVNQFVLELDKNTSDPLGLLNKSSVNSSLRVMAKVNELKANKELWEKAIDLSKASGGLSEVAVGTSGELYVKDENNSFKAITTKEYRENSDKYKVLTVSELMNARQYDPQLAFNKGVFAVAETSVGTNQIVDHIKAIVVGLGEESDSSEFYMSKGQLSQQFTDAQGIKNPTGKQLKGIEELARLSASIGSGPEGIYKFKKEISSERNHSKEALQYIWGTLGENAKNKLKANAALNGKDSSSIQDLLIDAMVIGTDHSETTSVDYDNRTNDDGSGSGSGGSMGKLSDIEAFLSGKFDMGESFKWNSPSTGKTMDIPITSKAPLFSNGKPTGMVTLGQFNLSEMAKVLDTNNISMGGKKVNVWDLNKVIYDTGLSARALMPVKSDGTPNLKLLEQFQTAQDIVKQNPEWTAQEINQFYVDMALPIVQVDGNKNIVPNDYMKPFLVFHAWTTDNADITSNNKNIEKLSSSEEDKVNDMLKPLLKNAKLPGLTGTFGTYGTDYYKGIVAYPILPDASARLAATEGNLYAPKTNIFDVKTNIAKQQSNKAMQNTAQFLMYD